MIWKSICFLYRVEVRDALLVLSEELIEEVLPSEFAAQVDQVGELQTDDGV
jgi:hypothetical protein